MKPTALLVFLLSLNLHFLAQTIKPATPPAGFKSLTTQVNGIKLHYVIGGKGEPLVLIHGFGQNWYMWDRILPDLAGHFTVIAPDLRGVGGSDKPATGYDKKTLSTDIHELVKQLGYSKANVAGHDIGLMVAYAYAAQFPADVKKLALLDALIPGIDPSWSEYWAKAWWWGFFGWKPSGEIVAGKERMFLTNFWPEVGYIKDPFTKAEKEEFIRAYATPGGAAGSFRWFAAFPQDVKDNAVLTQHKLPMPVMSLGGDHSTGGFLGDVARKVATNVKEVKVKDAGHWLVQEQTLQVKTALLDFFLGN